VDQLGAGDFRHNHPRFSPDNLHRNRELVRVAETIAAEKDVSIGRLALAWLLAQGPDIVPIPGTRTRTHLEMNAAATQIRLTDDERERLALAVPPGSVAGGREPRRR
jgi:aryl-alcohol dehydrogenase-like predicted oxidoreductase